MIESIIKLFKWIWKTISCKSECHKDCNNDCICGCNEKNENKIKEPQNKSLKEVSNKK